LRFAVWSPLRAAVEDYECAPTTSDRVQITESPLLIGEANVGEARANRRSYAIELQVGKTGHHELS
jgi:hypothetical protein